MPNEHDGGSGIGWICCKVVRSWAPERASQQVNGVRVIRVTILFPSAILGTQRFRDTRSSLSDRVWNLACPGFAAVHLETMERHMMKRLTLQFRIARPKSNQPFDDGLRLLMVRQGGVTGRAKLLWRRDLLHPPCTA